MRGILDHLSLLFERWCKSEGPNVSCWPLTHPWPRQATPVVIKPTPFSLPHPPQGDLHSARAPCIHYHAESTQSWPSHNGRQETWYEPWSDIWQVPLTCPETNATFNLHYSLKWPSQQSCRNIHMHSLLGLLRNNLQTLLCLPKQVFTDTYRKTTQNKQKCVYPKQACASTCGHKQHLIFQRKGRSVGIMERVVGSCLLYHTCVNLSRALWTLLTSQCSWCGPVWFLVATL